MQKIRKLEAGIYGLDEVQPGDWFQTHEKTVTAQMISDHAELSGDRFEIHLSDEAARKHGFPSRVAHGLLVLSVLNGMKNNSDVTFRNIASLHWDWRFVAPVLAGDTITARVSVAEKRETKNPERGILTLEYDVTNQDGQQVQTGRGTLMVYRQASSCGYSAQ